MDYVEHNQIEKQQTRNHIVIYIIAMVVIAFFVVSWFALQEIKDTQNFLKKCTGYLSNIGNNLYPENKNQICASFRLYTKEGCQDYGQLNLSLYCLPLGDLK